MSPFFSFVTATYNRSEYLPGLISCMSNQSFGDFEIIIVDDGSTDDTMKVLEELKKTEPRIQIIRQENKERGAARNNGISNAHGKYIVFVDSDDSIEENHLSTLHDEILRQDYPDFICNKFDIKAGTHTRHSAINGMKKGWYDYRFLLNGNIIGMYHAIRRENPELRLFEEDRSYSILEDWMFNFENLKNNRIYITDHTTYHLHDHSERSMRSDHLEIIKRNFKAVDWIISRMIFENKEVNQLKAYANYFAAVHLRIDGDFKASQKYLIEAIRIDGIRTKYVSLFTKLLLGVKLTVFYRSLKGK